MAYWKHTATRCAVDDCERTRRKGWTTCALAEHYALGVSLYGLKSGEPRLRAIPLMPLGSPRDYHDWLIRVHDLDPDASVHAVRTLLESLGWENADDGYAMHVVNFHKLRRYERETGHPF